MAFLNKPLHEITEGDIQARVKERVPEHQTLDYKARSYGPRDQDRQELLKDVTAMANTSGGEIIIGIEEDPAEKGSPGTIAGIDDGEAEGRRLIQICRDWIEEPIAGLDCRAVRLISGKDVLILRIPRSDRAPHMAAYRDQGEFWARHGTISARMRVPELRDAFRREPDVRWRLEQLQRERTKFRISPVVPLPREADEWEVESFQPGHAVLRKISSRQTVIVPLTWIREVRQDSLGRHIVLDLEDARMQWTHPSQRWQCLQPSPDPAVPMGYGKAAGGTDSVYVPLISHLQARGYELAWPWEHQVSHYESIGWEVIYGDDGCFLFVPDRSARKMLIGRLSSKAAEPR